MPDEIYYTIGFWKWYCWCLISSSLKPNGVIDYAAMAAYQRNEGLKVYEAGPILVYVPSPSGHGTILYDTSSHADRPFVNKSLTIHHPFHFPSFVLP